MTDVIYLAPLCQGYERMWCEHDAPIDCECIDGPHPWIKYVVAPQQPAQSEITQADIDAAESIFWVETIIDDHEAVAKAFSRHHQHGYDRGYYDGCAHTMDAWNRRDDVLREALRNIQIEAEREKGSWVHLKRVIALNCKAALERSE